MADPEEPQPTNRAQKLAAEERRRRFHTSGRSFLHNMTSSRVKRSKELLEKSDRRRTLDSSDPESKSHDR